MVTQTRLTLDEYLALPEEKPYLEYRDGEMYPKPMPTARHGEIVAELLHALRSFLGRRGAFRARTEVRHVSKDRGRTYLPDVEVISVVPGVDDPDPVPRPPEFAIEVLSPDDRASHLLERVDFFLREGVQLVWVVDPEEKLVTVYRPGRPPRAARRGDVLDGDPVLPGFELPVDELF